MLTRGNIKVSMKWGSGKVMATILKLNKWHPWLNGVIESSLGFYDWKLSSQTTIFITSPNQLQQFYTTSCATILPNNNNNNNNNSNNQNQNISHSYKLFHDKDQVLHFQLHSFPCQILLCSKRISQSLCEQNLKELMLESRF